MSQLRELTPEEIAAGERNISNVDLSATEIQALVRNMDHSKKKWRHLRKEEFLKKLEEDLEAGRLQISSPAALAAGVTIMADGTPDEPGAAPPAPCLQGRSSRRRHASATGGS